MLRPLRASCLLRKALGCGCAAVHWCRRPVLSSRRIPCTLGIVQLPLQAGRAMRKVLWLLLLTVLPLPRCLHGCAVCCLQQLGSPGS